MSYHIIILNCIRIFIYCHLVDHFSLFSSSSTAFFAAALTALNFASSSACSFVSSPFASRAIWSSFEYCVPISPAMNLPRIFSAVTPVASMRVLPSGIVPVQVQPLILPVNSSSCSDACSCRNSRQWLSSYFMYF